MEIKHIVFHTPGPGWLPGVGFQEQPDISRHVQHYIQLLKDGKLLLGGPFTDPDAGGMMITTDKITRAELKALAAADPAVKNGVLNIEVKTLYVAMK